MPFSVFFRLNQETSEETLKTQVSSAFPLAKTMPDENMAVFGKKTGKV